MSRFEAAYHSRIGRRMLAAILLFSSCVTLAMTGYILISDYRKDVSAIEEDIKYIEASYTESISLSLWNYDYNQIENHLNGLLNYPEVDYAFIVADGDQKYEAGVPSDGDTTRLVQFPLSYRDTPVGVLYLQLDYKHIYDRLISRAVNILMTQFFKTFLVSLFILAIVHHLITRYLIKLSSDVRRLSLSSIDKSFDLGRRDDVDDELSDVADALNSMSITIKDEVDKQKETERRLADRQHRLDLTIVTANLGIFEYSQKLGYFKCNTNFAQHFYAQKTEIEKVDAGFQWWVNNFIPEDKQKLEAAVHRLVVSRKTEKEELLAKGYRSDNSECYFQIQLSISETAEDIMVLGCQQDVTEMVLASKEAEHLNEQLEYKVQVRTKELQTSNEELSFTLTKLRDVIDQLKSAQNQLIIREKMVATGGMVAGIAHELNTPLGVCKTSITTVDDLVGELNNCIADGHLSKNKLETSLDDISQLSALMENNIDRASNLVNTFKEVAVDSSDEQIESFDIGGFINEFITSIRPDLRVGLEVVLSCQDNIVVESFPHALYKVLDALVKNAEMHAYDAEQEGNIYIDVERAEDEIEISIRDDGKGISKAEKEKIFDAFFTTKRNHGGLGLGLNIVYNLVVQALKGSIHCSEGPNGGAQFILHIPESVLQDRREENLLQPSKDETATSAGAKDYSSVFDVNLFSEK